MDYGSFTAEEWNAVVRGITSHFGWSTLSDRHAAAAAVLYELREADLLKTEVKS